MTTKPTPPLKGRNVEARAVVDAVATVIDDPLLHRFNHAVERVRSLRLVHNPPHEPLTAAALLAVDDVYATALAELDSLVAVARPAIEDGRRLAAELADRLLEEERLAAEAAAAAARQARIDAEIQRRTAAREAERLAAVEADVRAEMLGAGA